MALARVAAQGPGSAGRGGSDRSQARLVDDVTECVGRVRTSETGRARRVWWVLVWCAYGVLIDRGDEAGGGGGCSWKVLGDGELYSWVDE